MIWDTIGYSKDYRISVETTREGYNLHYGSRLSESQTIPITHEEASNLIRYLRQAEQARIDTYRVNVYEDGIDS